jgi:hypothetical protein
VTDPAAPGPSRPLLRVVRGAPDHEEVAALVAVLVAGSRPRDVPVPPASRWAARVDAVRAPAPAGPHAWRTSAWPR